MTTIYLFKRIKT